MKGLEEERRRGRLEEEEKNGEEKDWEGFGVDNCVGAATVTL